MFLSECQRANRFGIPIYPDVKSIGPVFFTIFFQTSYILYNMPLRVINSNMAARRPYWIISQMYTEPIILEGVADLGV